MSLDVLDLDEAIEMLRRLIDPSQAAGHGEALAEIASLCGYLPLALGIAAERMTTGEFGQVSQILDELRAEHGRLDALSRDEDELSTVRSVFSWSYHAVKPELASAFRLLGLHPGPEFSSEAAAALLGSRLAGAQTTLERLARTHLITAVGRGRYRFHDLQRIYAAECGEEDENEDSRAAAIGRILGCYLLSANAAPPTPVARGAIFATSARAGPSRRDRDDLRVLRRRPCLA